MRPLPAAAFPCPKVHRHPEKVFSGNQKLSPKTSTAVTAFVVGSKAPRFNGSLTTPDAPVWGGIGDSYSSGHHQDSDDPLCAPKEWFVFGPCMPVSLLPNDISYSWVTNSVSRLNKNVPEEWRYRLLLVAQSGATTRQMFEQGQVDTVVNAVAARGQTWSIISFSGGANNANFGAALQGFYEAHPSGLVKPWAVKNWKDCPDTHALYARLVSQEGVIRDDLTQIVSRGRAASSSVRFVDMIYPYVLKSDNVCHLDRQIPDPNDLTHSLTWHGAKSSIDKLAAIHLALDGPDIFHVDMRARFGDNPLPRTQQTRYYGYPHPNSGGENLMAANAVQTLP